MSYQGIIVAGPRASGKTTLVRALSSQSHLFSQVPAVTTRAPRDGDQGDYVYVSTEEFAAFSDQLFISSEYDGNLYGIRRADVKEIEDRGQIPVLIITPESASKHFGLNREGVTNRAKFLTVSLDAPDSTLDERLLSRSSVGNAPECKKRREQVYKRREADRALGGHLAYSIQNVDLDRSVDLLLALWNNAPAIGQASPR